GVVPAAASCANHCAAHQGSQKESRAEYAVWRRRHADRPRAAIAAAQQVEDSGEYRVRVWGRASGARHYRGTEKVLRVLPEGTADVTLVDYPAAAKAASVAMWTCAARLKSCPSESGSLI